VHRPFGQQLEDGGADIAAPTASSAAAATTTWSGWAEAESATGIECELEAATWAEAATRTEAAEVAFGAGTRVVLVEMVTKVIAEVAAGLPALLMKRAPIAGPEAEAESAGGWGEWVSHGCRFLTFEWKRPCASDTSTIYRNLS
jgi:hypothetical protein